MPRLTRPEERKLCRKCNLRLVAAGRSRCLLCRDPLQQCNQFLPRPNPLDLPVERPRVRRIQ